MAKILLIEDDTLIADLYERTLSLEGYEVDLAVDGEEGLTKFLAGGYDLILLDIMLPKINGIDILKRIRNKQTEKANGPVIILTNLDQDQIIRQGLELGASGYLVKSRVDVKQLLSEIKAFLAKGSSPSN
jgi:DNA-binding response OmpR family regulator